MSILQRFTIWTNARGQGMVTRVCPCCRLQSWSLGPPATFAFCPSVHAGPEVLPRAGAALAPPRILSCAPLAGRRGRGRSPGWPVPRGRGGSSVPLGAGARMILPARRSRHVPATSQRSIFPDSPYHRVAAIQPHHNDGCVGNSQSHRDNPSMKAPFSKC